MTSEGEARPPMRRVLVAAADEFSLLSLGAIVDPLRSANRMLGHEAYAWRLVTSDGRPARPSNGFEVAAQGAFADAPPADLVFLIAGLDTAPPDEAALAGEMRRRARLGQALGAVSTGPLLLGRAGLLDGHRCTVHWEHRAAFALAHPALQVTEAPFEIDRGRATSGGGTASFDMMLAFVARDHGAPFAQRLANQFQHERIRSSSDRQRPAHEPDLTGKPDAVARIIRVMAGNLEHPVTAHVLADEAGLSVRQVERLFLKHVQATPTNYYIRLRLERARELLRQTSASVLDIALSTGFASQSHFAQSYRAAFGVNPSQERKR